MNEYNIILFKNLNYQIIKDIDETERNIGYSKFNNVKLVGRNFFYPNVLLFDENNMVISPYDEKVMSLNKDSFYDNNKYELPSNITYDKKIITEPMFFFIYNYDNYYHFLYDTLPYLYTYIYLKTKISNLKLLVNYPNKFEKKFYKFITDFLEKIIDLKDMIIHDESNLYEQIFISSSLTHGGFSNNPPRKEVFEIFNLIKLNSNCHKSFSKFVYISRRTWINKDKSNIGTDYTTRRKMMNEDELVSKLTNLGFSEVFAENLSTDEKINLFSNAKIIVGSIGGGMANLLFSNKSTKSLILVTPYFLEINNRFKYSMETSDFNYFNDIQTYKEDNTIPLYCRAKITNKNSPFYNKIGEITEYSNKKYKLNISNNDVAGFNNLLSFDSELFSDLELELLDKGLNSPYFVNINSLIDQIYKLVR